MVVSLWPLRLLVDSHGAMVDSGRNDFNGSIMSETPTGLFSGLYLSGWRQFEFVELDLHPRLTILTGANGCGKTTILNKVSTSTQLSHLMKPLTFRSRSVAGIW